MKHLIIFTIFSVITAWSFRPPALMDDVTYKLAYDSVTNTYIMSAKSEVAYTGSLSRLTASTQVTMGFPHTTGGYQINNLMGLQGGVTPLSWTFTRLDAPAENPSGDYLFFALNNAASYTVFDFPADTYVDLFSFEATSGCLGNVQLFDNDNDPLNSNGSINADNSFSILAGGLDNKYADNDNSAAACSGVTLCMEFDFVSQAFIVSMEADDTYTGVLARLSPSAQVSIVVPAVSGGYTVTNLTGLQSGATPLAWSVSQINAPAENTNADYLFFTPSNATTYTPFDINANTKIPLFSFQPLSSCADLNFFDNYTDPLNTNASINPDNNIVILGGALGNLYIGDECGTAFCCEADAPIITKN